jgi:hypothetical protein
MGSWSIAGNALGTSSNGVLGTTDNNALVVETNNKERLRVDTTGNVGVGTTSPASKLDVNGDISVNGVDAIRRDDRAYIFPFGTGTPKNVVVIGGGPGGNTNLDVNGDISVNGVDAIRRDANNAYIFPFGTGTANNVVVIGGGPDLNMDLRVTGNVAVSGDVLLSGADCAEQFDVSKEATPEPGTVLVIDQNGALEESRESYDKKVAGVVSGAGDYKHGILLDQKPESTGRVAVALVGKVYCKVDADPAPIAVGDLLTTSARPGFAMKASDSQQAFGAVIGKALRPLRLGQGMIPILIALQ